MPSNGTIANAVLRNLDLNFQGQQSLNVNFSEAARASATILDTQDVLSSIFALKWQRCGCCTIRDLDLHFQCQHFLTFYVSVTVRASAQMRDLTSVRVYILQSNVAIANIRQFDFDLNFQSQIL